jgi:DNA-binding CsgD family transcriptional regulator
MKPVQKFPPILECPKNLGKITNSSPFSVQLCTSLLESAIEDLLNGLLILTTQQELLYANDRARQTLALLNFDRSVTEGIPEEIWHVCQSLIQSRRLFPNQYWSIRSEVSINHSLGLDVQAKWLDIESTCDSFLLLVMKDLHQSTQKIALEEAQKYGLTTREKDTWLLHRTNKTYKQIAAQLGITPNTVKKHMSSIHIKQKALSQPC